MGDKYELNLECAWCGRLNDVYYDSSSDTHKFSCVNCKRDNMIVQCFVGKKAL